jgi:nucleosome binding factor SPN SPT16 subunit
MCVQDPEGFIEDGGWSFLDAEQSDSDDEDGEEESDFAPRSDCSMVATAPDGLAQTQANVHLMQALTLATPCTCPLQRRRR